MCICHYLSEHKSERMREKKKEAYASVAQVTFETRGTKQVTHHWYFLKQINY